MPWNLCPTSPRLPSVAGPKGPPDTRPSVFTNNLADLQQQRQHKVLSLKDVVTAAEKDSRPMSSDEAGLFDRLDEEIKRLDGQITDLQAHLGRAAQRQTLVEDLERPNGHLVVAGPPGKGGAVAVDRHWRVPATARRTGPVKAYKPRQGESQDECDRRAYSA